MSLLLPLDDNGNPVGVAGFRYRGAQTLTVTSASTINPTPFDAETELVTIVSTGACRFEAGDETITADNLSSPILFPGIYVDVPLKRTHRHMAFMAVDADCTVVIMGRS